MSNNCPQCGRVIESDQQESLTETPLFTQIFADVFNDVVREPLDPETEKLIQLVLEMEPLPNDIESINEWASKLAADISKGRD